MATVGALTKKDTISGGPAKASGARRSPSSPSASKETSKDKISPESPAEGATSSSSANKEGGHRNSVGSLATLGGDDRSGSTPQHEPDPLRGVLEMNFSGPLAGGPDEE